jgi:hypothetical protein
VPLKPFNLVGVDARNRLLSEENPHGSLVDELARQDHGLILTKGKGGVGKATVAAAVAVALVNRGLPVHLTTSDPAAHLKGTLARAVEHLTIRCRTLIRPYRLLAESEDSRVATPTRQRFIELPHKTHRSGWPAHHGHLNPLI